MIRSVPSAVPGSVLLRMVAIQCRSFAPAPLLLAPKKAPKPTLPTKKKPTKAGAPTLEEKTQPTAIASPSDTPAPTTNPEAAPAADALPTPFDVASPEEIFFVQAAREGKEFLGSVPKWATTPVPVVPLTRPAHPAHAQTARPPTWHCGMCRSRNADTTSHCARCGSGKSLSSLIEEQQRQDIANDGDDQALTARIGTSAANDPSFAEDVDSNGPKVEMKRLQRIMPTRAASVSSGSSSYPQGGSGYNKPGGYQKAPYQPGQQGGYQKPQYQQGGYQKPPYQTGGYEKAPHGEQGGYQQPQGGYQKPPYQPGGFQKPPYQQGDQGGYQKTPYQQGSYQKSPYQPRGYQQPQQGGVPQQQQAVSQPWRP